MQAGSLKTRLELSHIMFAVTSSFLRGDSPEFLVEDLSVPGSSGVSDAIVLIALRHLRRAEGQTPRLQQLATVGIQTAVSYTHLDAADE